MSTFTIKSTDYLARTVIEETHEFTLKDAQGNDIKATRRRPAPGFIDWEKFHNSAG